MRRSRNNGLLKLFLANVSEIINEPVVENAQEDFGGPILGGEESAPVGARLPGLAHLYMGQEAVAVGGCANLTDEDYITSTHPGHGHCQGG